MPYLDIGIKVTKENLDRVLECSTEIREELKKHGWDNESSGCGFGVRDMQWRMKSMKQYNEALAIVESIVKKHQLSLDYPT